MEKGNIVARFLEFGHFDSVATPPAAKTAGAT
jgi:hypothetical protein